MKHVFIIGYPRSGTTWMLALLAHQRGVVGLQQGALFHTLAPLKAWWGSRGGHGKRVLFRRSGEDDEQRLYVGDLLTDADHATIVGALVDDVFRSVANAAGGAEILVEQTPENLELAEDILAVLPDAYFLHIVRDPRSIYCSQRSADATWAAGGFRSNPTTVARGWAGYMARSEALARKTDRYLEVKYEALLENGPEELSKVHAWLGLAADEETCRRALANCSLSRLRESKLGPAGFFRMGESAGWREEASRSQIGNIEFIAGREMTAKGYGLYSSNPALKPLRMAIGQRAAALVLPLITGIRECLRLAESWLRKFV
jgi:hypothetical protein